MTDRPSWDLESDNPDPVLGDRPRLDLMLRIPGDLAPREVWDLGCGAGETTALLARRHPGAQVHGLDPDPERLDRARRRPEAVDWVAGDIAAFAPEEPVDLIVSMGALPKAGDLEALMARLAGALAPDGVLAVFLEEDDAPPSLAACHGWLAAHCSAVEVWRTTYLHAPAGAAPAAQTVTFILARR